MNAVAYVISRHVALIQSQDGEYVHTTLLTIDPAADRPYHIQQTIHRDGSGIFHRSEMALYNEQIASEHICERHGEIEMIWVGPQTLEEEIAAMVWIAE